MSDPLRKEPRITAVLPVRVFGMDATGKPFNAVVHTLNISRTGALLANVDAQLNIGDIIGIQKGLSKAKFRVQWVGERGTPSQGQLGVECTEPDKTIWELQELTPNSRDHEAERAKNRSSVHQERQGERRSSPRHPCDIGVQISADSSSVRLWSRCTDISENGAYLESRSPMVVGSKFILTIFLEPDQLVVPAVVRTSFPGMGMGVQFQFDAEEKSEKLREYICRTFGPQEVSAGGFTGGLPELRKLAETIEEIAAWVQKTPLAENEIIELEEVAAALRRQLVGLRSELDHKATSRYIRQNRATAG